jgi:hypothetical protein
MVAAHSHPGPAIAWIGSWRIAAAASTIHAAELRAQSLPPSDANGVEGRYDRLADAAA